MKSVLILGCGNNHAKRLDTVGHRFIAETAEREGVVSTIDIDHDTKPDYVHNLNVLPWPCLTDEFDEVHAYEILEHFGSLGDYQALFAHFGELWRVLKPDGRLFASVPCHDSVWTFGDPGHTRIINAGTLVFFQRYQYEIQLGRTAMTDYRRFLVGDWAVEYQRIIGESFCFVMRAVK